MRNGGEAQERLSRVEPERTEKESGHSRHQIVVICGNQRQDQVSFSNRPEWHA
jgi:hypothetical protein